MDDVVTYNQKHDNAITNGITTLKEALSSSDTLEKRSILFCLDKYLDPYYGYDLSYFDDIIILLQEELFLTNTKEVKADILQLLRDYAHKTLDYLAEKLGDLESEPELLEEALYALGNTNNLQYIPKILKYEHHCISSIKNAAKEILAELSEANVSDHS